VDKGNTVIVIEHNVDVIKTSDWVIDMGPEGGAAGGTVIAQGTPEEVAANPDSYTGHFLAGALGIPRANRGTAPKRRRGKVSA
jgi:excinuclease ABC subunit A